MDDRMAVDVGDACRGAWPIIPPLSQAGISCPPLDLTLTAVGLLIFFYGAAQAFIQKRRAADNPWGAGATTLEWTLSSPPPFHQFEVLPRIRLVAAQCV